MTTDGGFEQWELLSHAEMLDLERRTADLDQTAPLSPPDPAPFSVTQQLSTLDDKATASAAAGKGTPPAAAPLSARTEAPPLSARTTLPKDAGKDAGRAEKAKADSSAARELTQTQELDALLDEVRNV